MMLLLLLLLLWLLLLLLVVVVVVVVAAAVVVVVVVVRRGGGDSRIGRSILLVVCPAKKFMIAKSAWQDSIPCVDPENHSVTQMPVALMVPYAQTL